MEHLPRYKTKSLINSHQIKYLKVNKKNMQSESNISGKILNEKNLKFMNNRQFGNDLTITLKNGNKLHNQKISSNSINQNKVNKLF